MNAAFFYITAFLLAFVGAFLWLVWWYKKDIKDPEPWRFVGHCFFFGILASIPFFLFRSAGSGFPFLKKSIAYLEQHAPIVALVLSTFFFAFAEEIAKHLAARSLGKKLQAEFDQIVDGMIYAIAAALGFAFAENVFYFLYALWFWDLTQTFWSVFLFRSFGTMLGHVIFSGVFGLFWGYAFLSKKITPKHTVSIKNFWTGIGRTIRLHILRTHILTKRPSQHGHEKRELIAEGLFVACVLHTTFNLFVSTEIAGKSLTFLIVPLLTGGTMFLSKAFLNAKNLQIWEEAM